MSANTLKFITTFLSVGKIRNIRHNKNNRTHWDTNDKINNNVSFIVIVVILLNFNVNNCFF